MQEIWRLPAPKHSAECPECARYASFRCDCGQQAEWWLPPTPTILDLGTSRYLCNGCKVKEEAP